MGNIPNWVLLAVQVISTTFVGGIGFFVKKEFAKSDEIIDRVNQLETKMAEEYVRKADYNLAQGEVLKKLDRIQDMLFELQEKVARKSN